MSFRDSCSLGLLHLGAHESPGYFCPARWPSKAVGPDASFGSIEASLSERSGRCTGLTFRRGDDVVQVRTVVKQSKTFHTATLSEASSTSERNETNRSPLF